jgi:hypothetical protein
VSLEDSPLSLDDVEIAWSSNNKTDRAGKYLVEVETAKVVCLEPDGPSGKVKFNNAFGSW